jgi:hypothetical protein
MTIVAVFLAALSIVIYVRAERFRLRLERAHYATRIAHAYENDQREANRQNMSILRELVRK